MADNSTNVVPLFRGQSENQGRIGFIIQALRDLQDLADVSRNVVVEPHRCVEEWVIAFTPFRVRLPGIRTALSELAKFNITEHAQDARWILEISDARVEAEHRLADLTTLIRKILEGPLPGPRQLELLSYQAVRLTSALETIQMLLNRGDGLLGNASGVERHR
jgi:hypothetical protein